MTTDNFPVQPRRNANAALKLMKKLLKKQGFAPTQIVTDKLKSYHKAFRLLGLTAEHIDNKRESNRAKIFILPFRQRERKMQNSKSPGSAKNYFNIHSFTDNNFQVQHYLINHTLSNVALQHSAIGKLQALLPEMNQSRFSALTAR